MSPDLVAELRQARPLPQRSIDVFRAAGVTAHALSFDADGAVNTLHMDRVVFGFEQRFEFMRHAKQVDEATCCMAFVWMARDLDGGPIDLVAWTPRRPLGHNVALWLGKVPMLGLEQVESSRFAPALPVHDDPEAWLRAGRQGVVIFDHWASADMLHVAAPLLVPTPLQGARLRDMLTIPAPKILVGEIPA